MSGEQQYRDKAARGFAWNHLYKLTEFGLMNIYTMVIARHFGPAGSTPYIVYAALGTTISVMTTFGVDGVLLRFLPRISESNSKVDIGAIGASSIRSFIRRLFAFRMLLVSIVAGIVACVMYVLPPLIPTFSVSLGSLREYGGYVVIYLLAQGVVAFSTFALIGLLNTRKVFFSSLIVRSLMLASATFFLIQSSFTIEQAVQVHTFSAVLNALLLLIWLRQEVSALDKTVVSNSARTHAFSIFRDSIDFLKNPRATKYFLATPIMLYGIATWGSDILTAILGRQPDILMLRAIYGEQTPHVGLYNVASLLILMTEYAFLLGLGGALVSILSKLSHDDETASHGKKPNYHRMTKARREVAGFQNVTLLPLAGFMVTFPLLVIRSIYGVKYDDSVELVRYGLVALIICVGLFGGGLQLTSLVAIGKERLVFKNRLFWGVVNLVANYFLIIHLAGLGAIIGTNVANACACMTEEYLARKYIGASMNYLSTLRIAVIVIASAFIAYEMMNHILVDAESLIRLLAAAGVYSFLVVGSYLVFRVPEAKSVFVRIGNILQRTSS